MNRYVWFFLWISLLSVTFVVTPWLNDPAITGKYFYFALAVPAASLYAGYVLLCNRDGICLCPADIAVSAFAVWVTANCIIGGVHPGMKLWLLMLTVPLYVIIRVSLQDGDMIRRLLYILLSVIIAEAVWGLLQLYGILESHHKFPTGSFFNSGPYAGFLACGIPPALYFSVKRDTGREKILGVTCLIAAGLILPATMSRAAWVAAVAGCVFVLYRMYFRNGFKFFLKPAAFVVVVAGLAVALLTGAYTMRPRSADGRLFFWRVSAELVRENPVTGCGLGSFPTLYDDAQANFLLSGKATEKQKRLAGTPEYAFNEYVQITVEHGIIGIVLFLGMVCSRFFFRGGTFEDKESDNVITAVRGSLTAFLAFAFFSYPFSVLPLTVLFVILTAAAASLSPPLERKLPRFAGMAIAIACLCPAGYASAEILSRYPAYREWGKIQQDYDSGYFEKAIDDYRRLYRQLDRERAFLYEYARCLTVTGQHAESNEMLDRYLLFGNDPAIFYLKAENYRRMNDCEAAERMYLRSLEILPNHFYTIHLLLNLYHETGQTEKAQEIRKMIELRSKKATERRGYGK